MVVQIKTINFSSFDKFFYNILCQIYHNCNLFFMFLYNQTNIIFICQHIVVVLHIVVFAILRLSPFLIFNVYKLLYFLSIIPTNNNISIYLFICDNKILRIHIIPTHFYPFTKYIDCIDQNFCDIRH